MVLKKKKIPLLPFATGRVAIPPVRGVARRACLPSSASASSGVSGAARCRMRRSGAASLRLRARSESETCPQCGETHTPHVESCEDGRTVFRCARCGVVIEVIPF